MTIVDAVNIKQCKIEVNGYKYPLTIQYGFYQQGEKQTFLVWNVFGTSHTFNEDLRMVIEHHGPKYEEYFELVLKRLREDMIHWVELELPEEWMYKYYEQFAGMMC
jgi:hypothetical protein